MHKNFVLRKGRLPINWRRISSHAARKQFGKSASLAIFGFVLLSIANVGGTVLRHQFGPTGEWIGFVATIVILLFVINKVLTELTAAMQNAVAILLPPGEELLASDKRPPVLYLRSFNDDRAVDDSEKAPVLQALVPPDSPDEADLCQLLFTYGPVVAVGLPGEELPPLGASRLYFEDNWQVEVHRLMAKAQIIAIRLGKSSGLAWELREALKIEAPRKILFVLPPRATTNEKNDLYQFLVNQAKASGGVVIDNWPDNIGDAAALTLPINDQLNTYRSSGFLGANAWHMSIREAMDDMTKTSKSDLAN